MEQSKFYQIKNITEQKYTLVGCDGSVITLPIQNVDKSASVFTIQDAKDGDVLSYNDGHGDDCIELIKSVKDKKIEFWFCLSNGNRYEVFDGIVPYTNFASRKNATPATKEQRDLLFQKMKEAGYEWDAEKKELRKIENSPILSNSSNTGKQWTEEDEKNWREIMYVIEENKDTAPDYDIETYDRFISWLDNIKQRMEEQQ